MSNSTTTTNTNINAADFIMSDRTANYVNEVLDDFRANADPANAEKELERVVTFLIGAAENPEDATEPFLEYFQPDPTKGREIVTPAPPHALLAFARWPCLSSFVFAALKSKRHTPLRCGL